MIENIITLLMPFIATFVQMVILHLLAACVLGTKHRAGAWIYIVAVMTLGGNLLGMHAPRQICAVVSFLCIFLLVFCFYKGSVGKKLLFYLVAEAQMQLLSLCAVLSIGWLRIPNKLTEYIVSSAFFVLLLILSSYIIAKLWNAMPIIKRRLLFLALAVVPVSQGLFGMYIAYLYSKNNHNGLSVIDHSFLGDREVGAILLMTLLMLAADALFIRCFSVVSQDIRSGERLVTLEMEKRTTEKYVQGMQRDALVMRRFRHDLLNLLGTLQNAIERGDEEGRASALELIRQMTKQIDAIAGKKYCECGIANSVLAWEEAKLAQDGVACDFEVFLPESLPVSELDFCRVAMNLLDNAGEACAKLEGEAKRRVRLKVKIINGYLYINTANYSPSDVHLPEGERDPQERGHGLSIVREITSGNEGELLINREGSEVSVTAVLRCKEG